MYFCLDMAVRRSDIPISVEITESAVHLWEFLQLIDNYPWLYEGLHVHNAVRRYELYWLPLVSKIDPRRLLAAPLDIEWVWYVHMLSPYAYNRDCLHRFGRVLDHRITSAKDRNIGLNNAREIWEKVYTEEEFSLDLTAPPKIKDTFSSKFSYNLFAAIFKQRFFNYQVALNHYRDMKFLEKATKRYKDFLCGKLQDPTLILNGCFDVQFIWHTHLVHPIAYRDDSRKVFGEMLSHYDTETGSGIVPWNGTPVRGKNLLAPKSIPGAMYRGENIICTGEQILLTQKVEKLTLLVKVLKEDFRSTVLVAKSLMSRDLMLTPCWLNLSSLSLASSSDVINITQGKRMKKYEVKVVHSLAPILSAVEVMHPKGYLFATAHTIAGKQIPMKSQLGELKSSTCAYTPEAHERAMLVRSQKDWGVVVGRWVGDSESGELIVSFYNLQTNTWQTVNRSNTTQAELSVFEIIIDDDARSVFVNLGTGEVTVPYTDIATFLPEIIALAYAIGVLYVLCRERTREFYPVNPFRSSEMKSIQPCPLSKEVRASWAAKRDGIFSSSSSGKKSSWLNRDPYVSSILMAAGRNCPWAPCNSFLYFFQESIRDSFENCILKSDEDRSSLDAKQEIDYLLEYLGVRDANKGHSETQRSYRGKGGSKRRHKEGHQNEGVANGRSGLKAARDRFSNVRINEVEDGRVDTEEPNDTESVFV